MSNELKEATIHLLTLMLLMPALAGSVERHTNPNQTYQGTISPLVLTLLAPLLAIPAALAHADMVYLIGESFDMPATGVTVASMKPLDPTTRYRISITAPLMLGGLANLAPLELMRFTIKDGVGLPTTDFRDPYALWSGIVINGKLARTRNYAELNYSDSKKLSALEFELHGTGRPLTLRTVKNFIALPTLRVDVWRLKPEPPPRPSMPQQAMIQQANNRESQSLPLPLVLGSIALTALIWRVIVFMRRRQLRVTLRRLMADIQRVEKARKTVHNHLD